MGTDRPLDETIDAPLEEHEQAGAHAYLFRVLHCQRPTAPSSRHSLEGIDEVCIGRGPDELERDAARRRLQFSIHDPLLSRTHARLLRVAGAFAVEDVGSRNGTLLNGAPIARAAPLRDGDLLEVGGSFFIYRASLVATPAQPADLSAQGLAPRAPGLSTLLPQLELELDRVQAVARAGVEMLVQGESGAGKELVARGYHLLSGRAGPFVATNCGALPATLVESELFGSKKGSFSGAIEDRPGLVRSADGGTLFLDEIGDLPLPAQAALLRVLQEREVMPVGGTRAHPVDVHVCAATHRDLARMARENTFRVDLLARIAGYTVHIPPLRERREDLGIIVAALLRALAPDAAERIHFTPDAARALFQSRWPHNVRGLEKRLTLALALAKGHPIKREHLAPAHGAQRGHIDLTRSQDAMPAAPIPSSAAIPSSAPGAPAPLPQKALVRARPEDEERRAKLQALLAEHKGNISAIARAMGSERFQIRRWLQRYRLDVDDFR